MLTCAIKGKLLVLFLLILWRINEDHWDVLHKKFDEVIGFKYAAIYGGNSPDKYFAKNYLVIDDAA